MSGLFTAIEWPFGVAVGTGVGSAVGGAITPGIQALINEANARYPLKPPSYFFLAEGVAKGRVDRGWARDRAAENGISNDAFDRLAHIAQIGPGTDVAFELWRRNLISDARFAEALAEESIDESWFGPLAGLRERLLTPAELANARQQEFIDDGRLHAEGDLQGYSAERMDLLYRMAGLPPGAMEGLELLRRGFVDEGTYRTIVAEGHTKTKYTDALLRLRDRIISATDAAGLWIRGWLTQPEAEHWGALNGYDAEQMRLLYLNRGRPATVHQAHIGYARGGRLASAGDNERETLLRSVQESDIRTEWFDLLYAQRYSYPSPFVIRGLAQDGTFDRDTTHQVLLEMGWKPEYATLAADAWHVKTTAVVQRWAQRAETTLFTRARQDFVTKQVSESEVRPALAAIGIADAEATKVLELWQLEADLLRLPLTPAQIKKAYRKALYTEAEALAELEERGMTAGDASIFLKE